MDRCHLKQGLPKTIFSSDVSKSHGNCEGFQLQHVHAWYGLAVCCTGLSIPPGLLVLSP